MAERRMFSKSIIDSDLFLDMPVTTRLLYYDLAMRADDDGFINSPKKIMRVIGVSEDDLKLLIAKQFIIPFATGVVVIKHWRIHNCIQRDRYKPTLYKNEMGQLVIDESKSYTLVNANAPKQETKVEEPKKQLSPARELRRAAEKNSSLPASFSYKIRQAFDGENCPICGCVMRLSDNLTKPTIQHNLPISQGGEHELDNISIICLSCNTSIQNHEETPPYNTDLVKLVWEKINDSQNMDREWTGNGPGMETQSSLGQVRLGEISLVQSSPDEISIVKSSRDDRTTDDFFAKITDDQRQQCQQLIQSGMDASLLHYAVQKMRLYKNEDSWGYFWAIIEDWRERKITKLEQAQKQKPKKTITSGMANSPYATDAYPIYVPRDYGDKE